MGLLCLEKKLLAQVIKFRHMVVSATMYLHNKSQKKGMTSLHCFVFGGPEALVVAHWVE